MKRLILIFVILLAIAGSTYYALSVRQVAAPGPSAPAILKEKPAPPRPAAQWNTYHGNNALTGFAEGDLPEQMEILWRFKAGAPVRETPVVAENRIHFVTARGELITTDFNGGKLWSQELFTGEMQKDLPVRENVEAPIACFDGLVFTGTERGMLYAHEAATGTLRWQTPVEGAIYGSPNYLKTPQGGRVYVLERGSGKLHCIDTQSGSLLWRAEGVERCDGSPSVSNEAIVFGSCAAALHILSPETGKLIRNIEIDSDSQVAGGVAQNAGRAYSGSRSGKVLQADVTAGKILWANTENEAEGFSTPAVSNDTVVQAYNDGNVCAIDRATGKQRWKFDTKGSPTSPVIAGDKVVVSVDGEVFVLKLADGAKLWSQKVSDEITSPAVIPGMILVGSEDGTMVAFGANTAAEGQRSSPQGDSIS